MKILNKFIFSIILLLVVSSMAFGQLGRFGVGGSLAVTETSTNYTITKDTVTIAGHLSVTTITFTTIVGTGTIDLTITNTTAGGDIGLNLQISQTTNALTGDLIGVRGNSRVNIDSPAGTAIGGKFQAGNMTAGYNLFVAKALYAEVVNKIPSGNKTWEHARGLEVNMDLNQGSSSNVTTFDNAAGLYMVWNLPTAGSFTTVTTGYGILMRNEQVGGNGQMLDAALYVDDLNMGGGVKGWDFGADFSGMEANFGTADFRLSDGALINNTDGDNLVVTEANIDFDGDVTGTSFTADADVTATNDVIGDSLIGNTGLRVGGGATIESDLTINPTVADGEDPSLIIKSDGDSDSPTTTSEVLTIKLTAAANPINATWDFTNTQASGTRFIGTGNNVFTNITSTNSGFAAINAMADGGGIVSVGMRGTTTSGTQFGISVADWANVSTHTSGNGLLFGTTTNDPIVIGTNDLERARIEAGGTFIFADGLSVYAGLNGNEENYLNVEIFNDSTVTGETTWSSVLPAGYIIDSIIFKNTTANEITDLDIGFTDGGGEIVAAANLLASNEGSFVPLLQHVDDFDAVDDIFISADNWNSANVIIYIRMVRIF